MEKVKTGLIGLSDTAIENHIKPLLKLDGVFLSGGYDTDLEAFSRVEQETGLKLQVFGDVTDLVRASDALIISTPADDHGINLFGCLIHRKHVLCQPPLCKKSEIDNLKDTFSLANSAKLQISTYYPRRFDPLYVWLKQQLSNLTKKYGKAVSLNTDFSYPEKRASKKNNLLGKYYDQDADYLNFLFGGGIQQTVYKIENSGTHYEIAGKREDGICFRFQGSCALGEEKPYENVELRLERATVYLYCGLGADKGFIMEHATAEMLPIKLNTEIYSEEVIAQQINQNFVDAIRGEAPCYINWKELLQNYCY